MHIISQMLSPYYYYLDQAYKTTLCMIVTNHKRSLYLIAKEFLPAILVVATSIVILLLQSKHILNSFLKIQGEFGLSTLIKIEHSEI
jgi:hypothetical protein